jgi:uncharacterized repeat protein (TIGR03803 family)
MTFRHAPTIGGELVMALLIFTTYSGAQNLSPVLTPIYGFTGTLDGELPYGGLAIGSGGVLYGTTNYGGTYGLGCVFSLTPPTSTDGSWDETVLHSFQGAGDGGYPAATLAIGRDGTLYGTTAGDEPSNAGTVFSLTPPSSVGGAWTENVLYAFEGTYGVVGPAGVAIGRNGVLYGATGGGGGGVCSQGCGTVFSLTPSGSPGGTWRETVLYAFTGGADGSLPAGIVIGDGDILFGTTAEGGTYTRGTVFSVTPPASPGTAWTETVLHSFYGLDGNSPEWPVVIGAGGVLYSSTSGGGAFGGGTVFSLAPPAFPGGAWTASVLHNFQQGDHYPVPGPVTFGRDGVLYGTTQSGGEARHGTIFALRPPTSPGGPWTYVPLYVFGQSGGALPMGGLAAGSGGLLYGTTSLYYGTPSYTGTVFTLTP